MNRTDRRRRLPKPQELEKWNNGFPTTKTAHAVRCPCCGETAQAEVVTVDCLPGYSAHWLTMPPGWAVSLGVHFNELRSLSTGLARCPKCIPQPKHARI
jgi:hypothetical protein